VARTPDSAKTRRTRAVGFLFIRVDGFGDIRRNDVEKVWELESARSPSPVRSQVGSKLAKFLPCSSHHDRAAGRYDDIDEGC
jgi:hypothetical protein